MAANQAQEQEKASSQAFLNQHYQCIRAKLETLSAEQLGMYLHEVKWLLEQLGKVIPGEEKPPPEMYRQSSKLVERVADMQGALILERARRQFLHLQALIAGADAADLSDTLDESKEVP